MSVCSGVQSEQHLQSGLRQEPAAQLQARCSHDAPGAIPLLPVRGDSLVPLPACQLRYVTPVDRYRKCVHVQGNTALMSAVF